MGIKFEFDADDFNRRLTERVEHIANEHIAKKGRDLQEACDAVHAIHSGDPVETVHEALEAELASRSFELPHENVREYAEAIAQGHRINVQVKPVSL